MLFATQREEKTAQRQGMKRIILSKQDAAFVKLQICQQVINIKMWCPTK